MFHYHMPTNVIFGPGVFNSIRSQVRRKTGAARPLIISDQGIIDSGILDRALQQLPEADVFSEIEANPRAETVNRGADIARELKPDLIVAIGGGSVLDAGKAIAMLATNEGEIVDFEGREKYRDTPIPLMAVPTTCGTGSEVTWVAVITDSKRRFKMSIKGKEMYPRTALVDPELLISLPPHLIASTALDALTHAIEGYTVKAANPVSDAMALRAVELLLPGLEESKDLYAKDEKVRYRLMLGSCLAGFAFGNSDVGAVHCIAESVGALFDIPHGAANAIFLPEIMAFNLPVSRERYADIAARGGIKPLDSLDAAETLIDHIRTVSKQLAIPPLHQFDIKQESIPLIAQYSFENNSNPSNPRPVSGKDYEAILTKTLERS